MRSILTVVALICSVWLGACASGDPKQKEPVRLELTVNAQPGVNPDDHGRPEPIVVRVYELKNDSAFMAADFFTLQMKDRTVLAEDVVKRSELQLRPGEHQTIVRFADPATTVIGVLAAYQDLPNSVWRAVYALPVAPDKAWYRLSASKVTLTIDLDTNAIKLTEVKK